MYLSARQWEVEPIDKLKLLFFTHYFPPEGNAPASRVYELCRRWVAAGHEVTVVTCAPNVPAGKVYEGYRNRLSQREEIDGIRVVRVWTLIAANKGTVLRMLNYVSYMISASLRAVFLGRPDLIIATSPQLFCGWAGVITKWTKRRPLILEVRDMWAESIVTLTSVAPGRLLRCLERFELAMYRSTPHLITVGEGYRRMLAERGIPRERMTIITNGIDREFFAPREADADLRARWALDGKFVCSYIGTIGLASGLDVVLRAAEKLRQRGREDIVFLLVGDGAVRDSLQQRAQRMGLDNVVLTGRQPKRLMPGFQSISHCSLVHLRKAPLYLTVLPSKIFEAAHMRRPIILGVAGEAAQVIEESGGGICIEPGNEDQLIDAVERLAGDPQLRERLGRAGHDYVARHFDWDRLAARYLEMLEQIVQPPA
jgi:glycosyltransferase involved in cell wall biosynthesis